MFGDFLLSRIVRKIDLEYCLLIGIAHTIDLEGGLLIRIFRTVVSVRRSGQEDFQRETPPVSLASRSISPFLKACIITV